MANNANIAKWVAALRSGDYVQGEGGLRAEEGYCCLGVACELYRQDTGDGAWCKDHSFKIQRASGFNELATTALPQRVMDWLGVTESDPKLSASWGYGWRSASNLNDNNVHGFGDIADAIELTLLPEEEL